MSPLSSCCDSRARVREATGQPLGRGDRAVGSPCGPRARLALRSSEGAETDCGAPSHRPHPPYPCSGSGFYGNGGGGRKRVPTGLGAVKQGPEPHLRGHISGDGRSHRPEPKAVWGLVGFVLLGASNLPGPCQAPSRRERTEASQPPPPRPGEANVFTVPTQERPSEVRELKPPP